MKDYQYFNIQGMLFLILSTTAQGTVLTVFSMVAALAWFIAGFLSMRKDDKTLR